MLRSVAASRLQHEIPEHGGGANRTKASAKRSPAALQRGGYRHQWCAWVAFLPPPVVSDPRLMPARRRVWVYVCDRRGFACLSGKAAREAAHVRKQSHCCHQLSPQLTPLHDRPPPPRMVKDVIAEDIALWHGFTLKTRTP